MHKYEQESPAPDFIQELYDVNCHAVQKPRVIGGSRITKEQAKALA
jgi:hypothetical protein